jgi:hypothetical protein
MEFELGALSSFGWIRETRYPCYYSAGTLMVTGEDDSRLVVTKTTLFDVDIGNDYEIEACFISSGDICVLVYEKRKM